MLMNTSLNYQSQFIHLNLVYKSAISGTNKVGVRGKFPIFTFPHKPCFYRVIMNIIETNLQILKFRDFNGYKSYPEGCEPGGMNPFNLIQANSFGFLPE